MRVNDFKKLNRDSLILKRTGMLCFVLALLLILVTYGLTLPQVQKSLANINAWFHSIELFIARYNSITAFFIVMALFVFKSFIPIIPFSVLFIGSGMVFSEPVAVAVNALGFAILVSIKFFWGKKFGGGKPFKILNKYEPIVKFMNFNGSGNKWMLSLLRFIPFIPVGAVSRAYGATEIKFIPYVLLSVLGFLPRLISWSVVGFNIFDPFSPTFIAPFVVLLIISGISLYILNAFLD